MVNIKCDNKQCSKCNIDGFCTIYDIIHINANGICISYIKDVIKKKDIVNLVGDTTDFKEVKEKEQ